jgi:hypothetical protein
VEGRKSGDDEESRALRERRHNIETRARKRMNDLTHLIRLILRETLACKPHDHPLLLIEPPCGWSAVTKDCLTSGVLQKLGVPAVCFANAAALALCAVGKVSGVVLTIGPSWHDLELHSFDREGYPNLSRRGPPGSLTSGNATHFVSIVWEGEVVECNELPVGGNELPVSPEEGGELIMRMVAAQPVSMAQMCAFTPAPCQHSIQILSEYLVSLLSCISTLAINPCP